MIERASSSDPNVLSLLRRHPRIDSVTLGTHPGIDFTIGDWNRSVILDDFGIEPRGLVEIMDNNPLICANSASIPSSVATLALIAVMPLIDAGILLEEPTMIVSEAADPDLVSGWLASCGWSHGVIVHQEPQGLGTVVGAMAMGAIATPENWDDIDGLYDERFGRSFFVRRDEESVWATSLVENQPHIAYRLRYSLGEGVSLLTINLLADRRGKVGSAHVVHAMNVMAGFEESLGIA